MIEEVQAIDGRKEVDNILFIERKDKYNFYLQLANKAGCPATSYVFSNTDVSKQGVNDLIAYMQQYSLNTVEWWDGNKYDFNYIYIAYINPYFFELKGCYNQSEIPTVGYYTQVFQSEDISEEGMQGLLVEFLTWYNSQAIE